MDRILFILSFFATGIQLAFGGYLTYREDYYIAGGCFLMSVFGFLQIYYFSKNNESIIKQIVDQQQELAAAHGEDKKRLTHNLAEIFGAKIQEQQEKLEEQKKRLSQATKIIEQKNKEIWALKTDDADYY